MSDRRSTPATARVALARLRGHLHRPAYTEGQPARVTAAVADLCREPGGARDRQFLFGQDVTVIDAEAGWRFVERASDGYCGWIDAAMLGGDRPPLTHRVAARATHVYREPDIKAGEVMALSLGARLAGQERTDGFLQLEHGGFVPLVHLATGPEPDPVAVAERLLGTPYLWGGNGSCGIDCSGLVQAALDACAIPCPGDSDQQWAGLGRAVTGPPRRGDVIFWRGHVALVSGPDRIIHANGHTMSVAFEGLAAAAARIADDGGGAPLGVKRVTD